MKKVRSLWTYLLPFLSILLLLGIVGNVSAKNRDKSFEMNDVIALYPVLDYSAEVANAPEDYFYNDLEPISIYSSEGGEVLVDPNDFLYFNGEIKKVKNCTITFKAEDGNTYKIPVSDVADYSFKDPMSKWDAPLMEMAMNPQESCARGARDARRKHSTGGYFLGGLLFGVFALIPAVIIDPMPRGYQFSDPDYLECYSKVAKSKNIYSALGGWGIWMILAGILASSA